MNKISLYPLFVGLIISSQLYANNEIVITGNVVDSTCVLTPADVNGSNSGNGNIAVVLNNVLAQDFTETNTEQGSKEFTLKLSDTNGNACDAVTSAQLTGMTLTANTPVVGSTGVALNEAYSEENPVNIMIKHNDTPVDLTGAVAIAPLRGADEVPTFTYQASYIASDATAVVAQPVLATLTYSLNYN